jgi:hypothetical protein
MGFGASMEERQAAERHRLRGSPDVAPLVVDQSRARAFWRDTWPPPGLSIADRRRWLVAHRGEKQAAKARCVVAIADTSGRWSVRYKGHYRAGNEDSLASAMIAAAECLRRVGVRVQ